MIPVAKATDLQPRHHKEYLPVTLVWLAGLVLGFLTGIWTDGSICGLYFNAAKQPVSASFYFVSVLLPLTISALAAFFIPFALLAIAFVESFFYGLSIACFRYSFGNAAWLILPLMGFVKTFSAPIFLYFLCDVYRKGRSGLLWNVITATASLLTVCILDFFWISPFLSQIFINN